VTVGRFALSRSVAAFVRSAGRHVSVGRATSDPLGTADAQVARLPEVSRLPACDPAWLSAWLDADARAAHAPLSRAESFVACALSSVEPGDLVWYGPSSMIRYAERVSPAFDADVVSLINRGTNGIDGVVSSAIGAALAHQRIDGGFALALMGDLTFLHDVNGLLVEAQSPLPNLVFVVLDSNGGRIFSGLEQGAPEYATVFDRVYGTPHNRDVAAIASAYGVVAETVSDTNALERAIADARSRGGIGVIVINDRE